MCGFIDHEFPADLSCKINLARFQWCCEKRMFGDLAQEAVTKPKLRWYQYLSVPSIKPVNYVLFQNRPERCLIARLRVGALKLRVETGRFRRLQLSERLCEHCSLGQIEDEFHFVTTCQLYSQERMELFENITKQNSDFEHYSDLERFIYLLSNNHYNFTKYVQKCWRKRLQNNLVVREIFTC